MGVNMSSERRRKGDLAVTTYEQGVIGGKSQTFLRGVSRIFEERHLNGIPRDDGAQEAIALV